MHGRTTTLDSRACNRSPSNLFEKANGGTGKSTQRRWQRLGNSSLAHGHHFPRRKPGKKPRKPGKPGRKTERTGIKPRRKPRRNTLRKETLVSRSWRSFSAMSEGGCQEDTLGGFSQAEDPHGQPSSSFSGVVLRGLKLWGQLCTVLSFFLGASFWHGGIISYGH